MIILLVLWLFFKFGCCIINKCGKIFKNIFLIYGVIVWVDGDWKWMFSIIIVIRIERVMSIIVNSKYLLIRGIIIDVGGIMLVRRRKNIVNDSKIEMYRVIFLLLLLGR